MGGKLVSVLSLVLDVTERVKAHEALRASEEKLRLAQESADIGAWDWNVDTGEMVMSDRCLELFGHPPGTRLTRETCLAAVHPEDRERAERASAEAVASGKDYELEMRVLLPDGTVRWVSSRGRAVHDAAGRPVRLTGMALDITERKRAEEALRESDRRKSEFLAVLSHELRNPLAPIRSSIHLLERARPGSEQAVRARDVIRRQTDHLARLVDDLLDVTRISRGKIKLERERIDLRDVLRRTCDDHRTLFEGRRIDLRVEMSGPVWIDADATRMAQVIGNLLQNAAKFSREGGAVMASIGATNGRAEIRVRDDGMGISPDLLQRVFEPFVQAAEGLARTKGGLGLGLALVKGLVELHGGSVRATSEGLERGAELVVTLPLAEPPSAAAPGPVPSVTTLTVAEVLIIEDNVDAAQTMAEVLAFEGHHVTVATDGRSGLERARELKPELILCDIGLPDVDGYEIARRLRADAAFRSTRLVAVSGYAQPEDRRRAKEAGFDAHVSKPASLDELLRAMRGGSAAGEHL
jgi:PAS domain S-box-containing protein